MKKIVPLLAVIALTSCKSTTELVGSNRSDKGCLGSAGYTWSQVRTECIQVFEQGVRLNPVKVKKGKPIYSAFVIFELIPPSKQVEIFLPMKKKSVILPLSSADVYATERYRFSVVEKTLHIKGELSFKGKTDE